MKVTSLLFAVTPSLQKKQVTNNYGAKYFIDFFRVPFPRCQVGMEAHRNVAEMDKHTVLCRTFLAKYIFCTQELALTMHLIDSLLSRFFDGARSHKYWSGCSGLVPFHQLRPNWVSWGSNPGWS